MTLNTTRPYGQASVIDAEQWAEVLQQATTRERALIRLQLCCLARISEILRVKWSDLEGNRLHLQRSKGGPATIIELPPVTLEAVEAWRRECSSRTWVFPGRKVRGKQRSHLSERAALQIFESLAERTGIRGLRSHSPRRSVATTAVRSGVALPVVMEAGGWRSLSSLQRYLEADPLQVQTIRSLL